jgi:hypothetical protein
MAVLIAVGVTLAPVATAIAASTPAEAGAMTDMPDCPSKTKNASKDCGCCDTKAPCPGDLCLAKCFKLNGEIVKSTGLIDRLETVFLTAVPARSPNSWPEPQARPPRT